MSSIEIPPALVEETLYYVKYSLENETDMIATLHRKHPMKNLPLSLPDYKERRLERTRAIKARLRALIQKLQAMHPKYPYDRCPECGKKLRTRRCLCCDLEAGRVKETEYA